MNLKKTQILVKNMKKHGEYVDLNPITSARTEIQNELLHIFM